MSRQLGKAIIDDLMELPHDHIRQIWKAMTKDDRNVLFGNGHAEELDNLIKSLGTSDPVHLSGDESGEFGDKLRDLHLGNGMGSDGNATKVLHTASGVRLAHRAALGPKKTGTEAHRTTMNILNARYREK